MRNSLLLITLLTVFSLPCFGQSYTTANICYDQYGKEISCRLLSQTLPVNVAIGSVTTADIKALPRFDHTEGAPIGTLKLTYPIGSTAFPVVPAQSIVPPSGVGQSYIAVGPQVAATTSGSPFNNAQTQAGGFVQGEYSFRLANIQFGMGGVMSVDNGVRFFPNATGAAFNAVPQARMYIPLSESWDFVIDGGVDMQRANDATIVNPLMTFGARHKGKRGSQQITGSYLFDDMNNTAPPQLFRGYRGSLEIQHWLGEHTGLLIGFDLDRQAQQLPLSTGPLTQGKLKFGLSLK